MPHKYSLFAVYGIEAEYMIVEVESLKVKPIADQVLKKLNNDKICNEVDLGLVSWSNELVNHVLEIKCTEPLSELAGLDEVFHQSILQIQEVLKPWGCTLMPTSMHPWFNPSLETCLWPHEQRDIYELYNKIFDCRGHGWSNLQSVHINLPYKDELEFVRLHSAIRWVLPLIPYLSASSPFYAGEKQTFADNRLAFYEKNQEKIPSIIGNIIPEKVSSIKEYKNILKNIYQDISHYDEAKTLQNPWLNSRAAIPKFDVGAIEIRLMDIQESPYMDFSIVSLIVQLIRFVMAKQESHCTQELLADSYLRQVYDQAKEFSPLVDLGPYFDLFEIQSEQGDFAELRAALIDKFGVQIDSRYQRGLQLLAKSGSLSQRLVSKPLSVEMYKKLIDCLNQNVPYEN